MRYTPTAEDKRIIRDIAERDAGKGRVEICPTTRHHVEDATRKPHMNVCMVSDEPEEFGDTDLFDNSHKWDAFTRGVELTEDGRGVFDFYVYSTGKNGELETNVTAYYAGGRLVRVVGTGNTEWKAES